MDSVLITTAMTSVSVVKEALAIALGSHGEQDRSNKVAYLLHQMGMIHDTLFYIRNELSRLHVENAQLRRHSSTVRLREGYMVLHLRGRV
jgi:hypothetical protein